MAVDYDLVLVGSNLISRELAVQAVRYGARTAWVTFPQVLSPFYLQQYLHPEGSWQEYIARQGVDLIESGGKFVGGKVFQGGDRFLSARHFVICVPPRSCPNPNDLLQQFYTQGWQETEVMIAGGNYFSCAIAQLLRKQGKEVTLLLPQGRILYQYDREVTRLLQAHLEAEGIRIHLHHPFSGTETAIFPVFSDLRDLIDLDRAEGKRIHYLQSQRDISDILWRTLWWGLPLRAYRQALTIFPTDPPLVQWGETLPDDKESKKLRSFASDYYLKITCDHKGKILAMAGIGQRAVDIISAMSDIGHPLIRELLDQVPPPTRPTLWLNICRDFDLS